MIFEVMVLHASMCVCILMCVYVLVCVCERSCDRSPYRPVFSMRTSVREPNK